jgi:hypothetical protein|tara:strand:+ start:157 stop:336 length:180 start_codon:yes stop_codon:yes gene_type:complete
MGKMNNWMMDIEDFCNGYFYGGPSEFTIDEVVEDVGMYFKSGEAVKYARRYMKKQLGEA